MTARDRLARAIGLYHALSESDVEDIVDQGLGTPDDFGRGPAEDGPPTYTYRGRRWAVEYRDGRPHLIDAIEVPSDAARSAATEAEHRFALVVDTLEAMRQGPLTDGRIAELREDGWGEVLEEAARRDRERPSERLAAMESTQRQRQRLGRAQEILGAPAMLPRRVPDDATDEADLHGIGRFLIITLVRMHAGAAECRIDFTEDAESVLSQVARLILGGHRLLRVCDLDADSYQDAVGITLLLAFTDQPLHTYERTM
jgi:hypothetical protein